MPLAQLMSFSLGRSILVIVLPSSRLLCGCALSRSTSSVGFPSRFSIASSSSAPNVGSSKKSPILVLDTCADGEPSKLQLPQLQAYRTHIIGRVNIVKEVSRALHGRCHPCHRPSRQKPSPMPLLLPPPSPWRPSTPPPSPSRPIRHHHVCRLRHRRPRHRHPRN